MKLKHFFQRCCFPCFRPLKIKVLLILFAVMYVSQTIVAQPQEVPSTAVIICNFIGTVEGSSGYGKKVEWKSIAKAMVLNRADKLGASHVVWDQFNSIGAFNGIAIAKVYKCNS